MAVGCGGKEVFVLYHHFAVSFLGEGLLMAEILQHLGCMKP